MLESFPVYQKLNLKTGTLFDPFLCKRNMRALLKSKRLVYFYICRGELSGICEPHTVYSALKPHTAMFTG